MPNLKYIYKIKKENKHNFQAQFMIPQELWAEFKNVCEKSNTTPSKNLRKYIKKTLGIVEE